jgi:hypothetical protein
VPYYVKIAKGLHLRYHRGAASGSWAARRHRGVGHYETDALGIADERLEADGIKVLDFWQAQDAATQGTRPKRVRSKRGAAEQAAAAAFLGRNAIEHTHCDVSFRWLRSRHRLPLNTDPAGGRA